MKNTALIARIIMGSIFVIFGLNGFYTFIPVPPQPEPAANFIKALIDTRYMMPLIKAIEVIGGLLLLAGLFVPLALVILAPIVINIFLFHLLLAPAGLFVPVLLVVMAILLSHCYRDQFLPVMRMK